MSGSVGAASRRVELVMFSGDRILFGRFELPRALLHRYMMLCYAVTTGILSQLELFTPMITMSAGERLAVVLLSIGAVLGTAIAGVIGVELWHRSTSRLVIRASPFLFAASGVSAVATEWFVHVVPGEGWPGIVHLLIIWCCFYVISQILTHFLMLKVMTRALNDMRGGCPRSDRAARETEPRIEIKGQLLRPGDILRVAAEGNYIRVVTNGRQHFLPGPFGPVIEALPPDLGVQVSRSDWVAAAGVAGLRKAGRDIAVEMIDGTTVRVAQSRRKAVTEWVQSLGQGRSADVGAPDPRATSTQSGKWREAKVSRMEN